MTKSVTIEELAESLYEDFIAIIVRQISVNSLSRHCALVQITDDSIKNFSSIYPQNLTKDIFGQDKSKLKALETSRYFECGNCGRKISGGRFASHINKCLDRDRR